MESIVDKLAEGYKDMIDATLSEEDSQVSDDKKEVLRSKLMSLFTEKLRFVKMRFPTVINLNY